MTQINSYAQARISFYEARFQSETIDQLVNNFNSLAGSRGWTTERSYFSHALVMEMQQMGIDLSAICQVNSDGKLTSISYRHHVRYDKKKHALIPVS